MMRVKQWLLLGLAALALAACAGSAAVPGGGAAGEQIVCTAAYRPGVGTTQMEEQTLTLAAPGAQESAVFADLTLQASSIQGEGEGGRALALRVTPAGSADPITAQLYQIAANTAPLNQFVGGHGFTGLTYAYHPQSGAELQFWCSAAPDGSG